MKLYGITCVFNEELLVPYVMKYACNFGYDRFIVYDNECSDRTIDLLAEYPFVEIRPLNTNGIYNEVVRQETIYNTIQELKKWNQESGNEMAWITISDFDEIIYCPNEDVKGYLTQMSWCGYNVCTEHIADLMLRCDPICVISAFPHEDISAKVYLSNCFGFNKPTLFRLDTLEDYSMAIGNHFGNFRFSTPTKSFAKKGFLFRFHLKYLFKRYFIQHARSLSIKPYLHHEGDEARQPFERRSDNELNAAWDEMYHLSIDASLYIQNTILNRDDSDEHGHQLVGYGDGWWGN